MDEQEVTEAADAMTKLMEETPCPLKSVIQNLLFMVVIQGMKIRRLEQQLAARGLVKIVVDKNQKG